MVFVIADVPISDRLPSPDVVPNVPDEDSRVDWSQYELTDNSDLVGSTDETHSERDPNHNYQVDDQTAFHVTFFLLEALRGAEMRLFT